MVKIYGIGVRMYTFSSHVHDAQSPGSADGEEFGYLFQLKLIYILQPEQKIIVNRTMRIYS
jgi:hypothetical protein